MTFSPTPQPFYIRNSAQIILATGLVLIAGALFIFAYQYLFMKEAHTAIGRVIGFDVPKGKVLKRPIIEFITPDQQNHTYYHPEGTNPPGYRLGEQIKVYYDPLSPENVSLGYSLIPMLILSIFGLVFTGVGITLRK